MDMTSASTSLLLLLVLFLFTCNPTATSTKLESKLLDDGGICALINCGEGTCVLSNGTLLGFECQCYTGWKKMFPLPSCNLPNCSVNLQCGNGGSLPPITLPPLLNLSDPCNIVFCGYGNCAANGKDATCNCDDGYSNLFGNPALLCVPECFLGGDCDGLGLSPPPPPAHHKNDCPGNVVRGVPTSLRISYLMVVALMAAFLSN